MTIFDILNSLLYTKKDLDLNIEDEQIFNLFMVNRWCSMYSGDINTIINHTTNQNLGRVLDTKQEQFQFIKNILPKVRFKKLFYIKKNKEQKTSDSIDQIKLIAKSKELSIREIKQYVELIKQ